MRSYKEIKKYWEDIHHQKHLGALSGCQFIETIDHLKVRDVLKVGDNVLEVGVGLGYVTQGLKEFGANVSVLDISQEALDRVKGFCVKTYLSDNLQQLPDKYFDLIICHNVIQHIPTHILDSELYYIIRSLKESGIFAVEFISSDLAEDTGSTLFLEINTINDQNIGCYCRSPKFLEKLIGKYGGNCKLVYDYNANIAPGITGAHIFHVRRI